MKRNLEVKFTIEVEFENSGEVSLIHHTQPVIVSGLKDNNNCASNDGGAVPAPQSAISTEAWYVMYGRMRKFCNTFRAGYRTYPDARELATGANVHLEVAQEFLRLQVHDLSDDRHAIPFLSPVPRAEEIKSHLSDSELKLFGVYEQLWVKKQEQPTYLELYGETDGVKVSECLEFVNGLKLLMANERRYAPVTESPKTENKIKDTVKIAPPERKKRVIRNRGNSERQMTTYLGWVDAYKRAPTIEEFSKVHGCTATEAGKFLRLLSRGIKKLPAGVPIPTVPAPMSDRFDITVDKVRQALKKVDYDRNPVGSARWISEELGITPGYSHVLVKYVKEHPIEASK